MADGDLAVWRPSLVIGSTYVAQGLIAYVGALMIGLLAQLGTPLEQQVGVLATGALPWVLKFVLGLLLDLGPSWPLRVRSLVSITLQGGAAVATWGLAQTWAPGLPSSLAMVGLGWLALNFAMAVQDTLVDALALDLLADHRTIAATSMGFGHALGFAVIGPLGILPVVLRDGLSAGFELAAITIAVVALTPLSLWAPGRPRKARERETATRPRSSSDWRWLLAIPALGLLAMLGPNITTAIGSEFLFGELHWEFTDYAALLLPIGAITGLLGALSWGPLVTTLGPARASAVASLLLGTAWLIFASLSTHWTEPWLMRSLAGSEGFLQAAVMVGLYTLALHAAARSPLPITGFVVAMAALNLPRVLGPLLAPTLVEHGWIAVFAGCGAVQILAAIGLAGLGGRAKSTSDPERRGVE